MSRVIGLPELFLLPFMLPILLLYFSPLVVVLFRRHRAKWPVALVNLFLGWTVVGWIVALAMALSPQERRPG